VGNVLVGNPHSDTVLVERSSDSGRGEGGEGKKGKLKGVGEAM